MNRVGNVANTYKLTMQERETVILFNEADGTAEIETFNPRLLRQLRKVSTSDGVICEEERPGYGAYIIPKTMIKIQAPRTISEELRAEYIKRAKKATAARLKKS